MYLLFDLWLNLWYSPGTPLACENSFAYLTEGKLTCSSSSLLEVCLIKESFWSWTVIWFGEFGPVFSSKSSSYEIWLSSKIFLFGDNFASLIDCFSERLWRSWIFWLFYLAWSITSDSDSSESCIAAVAFSYLLSIPPLKKLGVASHLSLGTNCISLFLPVLELRVEGRWEFLVEGL